MVKDLKPSIDLKRRMIKALILSCPYGEPLNTCPLNNFKELTKAEQAIAVAALTEKELEDYIYCSNECSKKQAKQRQNTDK